MQLLPLGDLLKLKWLAEEHAVPLTDDTALRAAESGSIEMIEFLRAQGVQPDEDTLHRAATRHHVPLVRHLRALGVPWTGVRTWYAVLVQGHLDLLQLMETEGVLDCPPKHLMAYTAARSGNVAMLQYLEEHLEVVFHETRALHAAARDMHLAAIEWLLDRGCESDAAICTAAVRSAVIGANVSILSLLRDRGLLVASDNLCAIACDLELGGSGQLLTLQWLREHLHCPWHRLELATTAATSRKVGSFAVLRYILAQGEPFSPAELTVLLNATVSRRNMIKAQSLREQGAEWPAALIHADGNSWSDEMITWAVSEGCIPQT